MDLGLSLGPLGLGHTTWIITISTLVSQGLNQLHSVLAIVDPFAAKRPLPLWQLHQSPHLVLVERLHFLGHRLDPPLSILALNSLLIRIWVSIHYHQGI